MAYQIHKLHDHPHTQNTIEITDAPHIATQITNTKYSKNTCFNTSTHTACGSDRELYNNENCVGHLSPSKARKVSGLRNATPST